MRGLVLIAAAALCCGPSARPLAAQSLPATAAAPDTVAAAAPRRSSSGLATALTATSAVALGAAVITLKEDAAGLYLGAAAAAVLVPPVAYAAAGRPGHGLVVLGLNTALHVGLLAAGYAICDWDCGPGDDGFDAAWVVLGVGNAALTFLAMHQVRDAARGPAAARPPARAEARLGVVPSVDLPRRRVGVGVWAVF
jgi:hypothetical protein